MSGNAEEQVVETKEVETPEVKVEEKVEVKAPVTDPETKEIIEDANKSEDADKGDDDKKDNDQAGDDGEGKDKDSSNTPSTDIVFPEDSNLTEEQQSEAREVFGSQENYDKAITLLQNISSEQIAKDEASKEAQKAEWTESLKKDETFGKNYTENMEMVNKFLDSRSEEFKKSIDINNPAIVKELHSLAKEREDANVHISNNATKKQGLVRDQYGKPQFTFSKTLDQIKKT